MKTALSAAENQSPARRLGSLYIATLSAVALLAVVCQAFILRELSELGGGLHPICRSIRQHSLEHSLSHSALAIRGSDDRKVRLERLATFRKVVAEWKGDAVGSPVTASDPGPLNTLRFEVERRLERAEPHRLAAISSAEALLAEYAREGRESNGGAATATLTQEMLAAEERFRGAIGEAAHETEQIMSRRINRLKLLEYELFGLTLIVLLLEGLFVISPAVRRIRHFMAEMERAHESLKVYAARLERSNLELQDFASVASHDLQEPLRKVQAFSDRLKSKYAAALDDQGRDYLERVQNAARRMQTLINDLLTYARVTTKAQPFVPTDLGEATREVVSDLEVRIEQAQGTVEIADLPTIDADPLQVRQLMQNLIGNALKYRQPDVPPVVKVYGRRFEGNGTASHDDPSHEQCQIVVEDNGIGFDEVYKDRIFTIFQRLHGRSQYEGTGVGLAVCRKITERHGGTITARSRLGNGSTFLVTLPVRQPKETIQDGCE